MRNAFIQELISLARKNKKIILIVGDLGFSVVEPFAEEFPERFFNAGVAEQNMAGIAAGMASEGYHVFVYSIANFPTFRCAEQLRNDVAYHNLSVTVVSVGGGVAYGGLGYSHHAVQDYALMRTMPNMTIAAPGDPLEVRSCLRYLTANPGPSYLRLGKTGERTYHKQIPDVVLGRWLKVRGGNSRRVLLSTGAGLQTAMEWGQRPDYSERTIFSLPIWSMSCKNSQLGTLRELEDVITIEDHLLDGGFGSWLCEARSADPTLTCVIRPAALNSAVCGMVASQNTLHRLNGL